MATRTQVDGLTFDSRRAGSFTLVTLPSFGTANNEMAAKIVQDGTTIAVVMSPLARWNAGYGQWSRSEEVAFRACVQQLATHLQGESEIPYDPR